MAYKLDLSPEAAKMAKTLFILYAAALARASEESRLPNSARSRHLQEGDALIIEDFAGPADAFFLDDGSAAGLPSSGNSALEKVEAEALLEKVRDLGARSRAHLGRRRASPTSTPSGPHAVYRWARRSAN